MAKYLTLIGSEEFERLLAEPGVKEKVEEVIEEAASSLEPPEGSEKQMPSDRDYWRGVKDKPDSWWAALHRKMFGPDAGQERPPSDEEAKKSGD